MEEVQVLIPLEKFEEYAKAKEQLDIIIRIADSEKYSLDRKIIEQVCGVQLKNYDTQKIEEQV